MRDRRLRVCSMQHALWIRYVYIHEKCLWSLDVFDLATNEKVQMACMKQFYYFEATNNDQCQRTTCNTAKLNMFAEFAYSLRTFFASDSFSFLFVCARVDCFFFCIPLILYGMLLFIDSNFSFIHPWSLHRSLFYLHFFIAFILWPATNELSFIRTANFFFFDARSNAVHRLFALQFILLYFFLSLI